MELRGHTKQYHFHRVLKQAEEQLQMTVFSVRRSKVTLVEMSKASDVMTQVDAKRVV